MTGPEFLPTRPATQLAITARPRRRPCWRCRLAARMRVGRLHFQCRPLPALVYLDPPAPGPRP